MFKKLRREFWVKVAVIAEDEAAWRVSRLRQQLVEARVLRANWLFAWRDASDKRPIDLSGLRRDIDLLLDHLGLEVAEGPKGPEYRLQEKQPDTE